MSEPENNANFNPILLQPATPQELSALVTQAGNTFTQAHMAAGRTEFGDDLPLNSAARFGKAALNGLPILRHWDSGEVQYSPPVLGEEVTDAGEILLPPSLLFTFTSQSPNGLQRSSVGRILHLVPDLTGRAPHLTDNTIEVDEEAVRNCAPELAEAAQQELIETWQESRRQQEIAELELQMLGLGQPEVSKGELKSLSRLIKNVVTPKSVRVIES